MLQNLVVAYLVMSLPAALLLWTGLVAARRADDKSLASESSGNDRFLESKTESINFYLS